MITRVRSRLIKAARAAEPRLKMLLAGPQGRKALEWVYAGHDKSLRLDYDLDSSSLVIDLGGYEGQWTSDIFSKYACSVWVFEPVPSFAEHIAKRFERNPKIRVFPFGLGARNETAQISVEDDASSLFADSPSTASIRLVEAAEFLRNEGVARIDLMKINIEGGEYDLLEHLLDEGLVDNITDLQIQFHDFVPDARSRMRKIQERLAVTHKPTYQLEFVWENWTRTSLQDR